MQVAWRFHGHAGARGTCHMCRWPEGSSGMLGPMAHATWVQSGKEGQTKKPAFRQMQGCSRNNFKCEFYCLHKTLLRNLTYYKIT